MEIIAYFVRKQHMI